MSIKILTLVILMFFGISACSNKSEPSTSASKENSESKPDVKADEKVLSFNAMDFSYALFAGADTNGKTKEQYLLDIEGSKRIKLLGAFVYGKDTSGDPWSLLIGDNTPRIICEQQSKEAKMVIANLTGKLSEATINGDYKTFTGNKLYLTNCAIE